MTCFTAQIFCLETGIMFYNQVSNVMIICTDRTLEVYKTLHNLNPAFMKDYFLPKSTGYDLRRNDVLFIPKVKTTNYGIRSISYLSPKIWNSLQNELKLSKNANQFKILIKDWYFENKRVCNACSQ